MDRVKRKSSKVIGYWMSEKKSQKLNWTDFASVCREHGYSLIKINLDMPLEEQGPFTVILHKLTVIIASAIQGNAKAQATIDAVEHYIRRHPEMAVIDPLENVRKLLDRYVSYRVVHDSKLEEIDVFIPMSVELTSDDPEVNLEKIVSAGIGFPFVCKPSVGHGTSDCHKVNLTFIITSLTSGSFLLSFFIQLCI
uniref:ATP-grasp domain-containing protein n=1 Tax=Clastoptera arizonana TaxID=38151 RepID=A0A1B6EC98_9HEMI